MGGTLFIRILPTTSTTPQLQSFQTEGMDTMTGNDIFNSLKAQGITTEINDSTRL